MAMRCVILLVLALAIASASADLVNEKVARKVILDKNEALVKVSVTVRNDGEDRASFYELAFTDEREKLLADATIVFPDGESKPFVFEKRLSDGTSLYRAPVSIAAGESTKLKIEMAFMHLVRPSPRRMPQMQKLFVAVRDSDVWFSPYRSESQSTTFRLGTSEIASFSPHGKRKKTTVVYGPVTDQDAFATGEEVHIRFFHDKALITATRLVREIEISHWGNIAVEESYELLNSGAELEGRFSRVDYDSGNADAKAGAFHWLHANFPVGTRDMYVRDAIGNVSTSKVRQERKQVHAEIASRFPLYGGWKTDFYLGYNLPSEHGLYVDESGRFVLRMLFGTPFDDIVVDDIIVRVILPEGASSIEWQAPFFDVVEGDRFLRFTYMDVVGRPVLELRKRNVVSGQNGIFEVTYSMPKYHLMREPLMFFTGFMMFFLACALYMRLDLSLGSSDSDGRPRKLSETQSLALEAAQAASSSFDKLVRLCIDKSKDSVGLKAIHVKLQQQLKIIAHEHSEPVSRIETSLKLLWKQRSDAANSKFQTLVSKIEKEFKDIV